MEHLKKDIVEKYRRHETDTGSPEVQVAIWTDRIAYLTQHLQSNPKDHQSQRGLHKLVSARRRLLNYLKNKNIVAYRELIERLGIRK